MKEKNIGINLIFNGIKTLMGIIFPLLSFPYASRVLGVENIGLVQYYNSIISYFALLASLGIVIYAVREGSKYRDDKDLLMKFSNEILLINIISMMIAYILLILFIIFIAPNMDILLMSICSMLILFQTFSIEWLYQIKEDYAYISIRSVIFQFVSLICLYCFVKSESDYLIYAAINVIATGGSCIFNLVHSKKYISLFKFKNLNLKRHIKPIFMIFGTSLASSIYMNLNNVMLGVLSGTYAVGLYTVAVKINQIVKTLMSSITNVLFPRISNLVGRGNIKEYTNLLMNGMGSILMILIPCSIGLICISYQIIIIFSGEEYINANFAAQILSLNLMISVIDGMFYYQILLPHHLEKKACFSTLMGAVFAVIINLILIPVYGYNGAAISTLFSETIVFIMLVHFSKKIINLRPLVMYTVQFLLACIPMVIVSIFINYYVPNIFNIFIIIPFAVISYFFILLICKNKFLISLMNRYHVTRLIVNKIYHN